MVLALLAASRGGWLPTHILLTEIYAVLPILQENGCIRCRAPSPPASLSRSLRLLEKRGLVVRHRTWVAITDAGTTMAQPPDDMAGLRQCWPQWFDPASATPMPTVEHHQTMDRLAKTMKAFAAIHNAGLADGDDVETVKSSEVNTLST